ncbi:unnamed protein product [Polarella glacialis]|uniref:RNA helicase n=1 Tax=Polarella glacialis TaxID=89957 RepID=A0A813LPI4_POLGL|nr:unnamed protein product [Polarella glacialis]
MAIAHSSSDICLQSRTFSALHSLQRPGLPVHQRGVSLATVMDFGGSHVGSDESVWVFPVFKLALQVAGSQMSLEAAWVDSAAAKEQWRQLDMLAGDWEGSQGKESSRWTIKREGSSHVLYDKVHVGWHSILSPPDAERWRWASRGSWAVTVRLVGWNKLEVVAGVGSRSAWTVHCKRKDGQFFTQGSVVLLSSGSDRRLGKLERNRESLVICCGPSSLSGHQLQVRLLGVSLPAASRELQAVWGARAMPQSLLSQLLGSSPGCGALGADGFFDPSEASFSAHRPPCLQELNKSQVRAVDAATKSEAGFSLIWGPPGTGKSQTVLALINAIHLRKMQEYHMRIEEIVLGPDTGDSGQRWREAVERAPRLLVTASSNAAVEGLLKRVCEHGFKDTCGNRYDPWGLIRVGTDRGLGNSKDLDDRVKKLLEITVEEAASNLKNVNADLEALTQKIGRLRREVQRLKSACPLPRGWEAVLSDGSEKQLLFYHVESKRVSNKSPPPPSPGEPQVLPLQMPHVSGRLTDIISCSDSWWQLSSERDRLVLLAERPATSPSRDLLSKIEASLLGTGHVVFATLNSSARLRPFMLNKHCPPFSAVVVDEAAQASEPSTLVPLELAGAGSCVLLGDDRQLPPTVFTSGAESQFVSRPLFERLRLLGHSAHLLDEQYRMRPEISAFPRAYFYGRELRDAQSVLQRPTRKLHKLIPPFLFLDLGSSRAERTPDGSWRNEDEARLCAQLVAALRREALRLGESDLANDIGVITPYRAQQSCVQQALQAGKVDVSPGIVQTVDAYQGREFEVVIFSTTRASPASSDQKPTCIGFLADERRLNVALTRSRSVLIVVGHANTLVAHAAFRALIAHARLQTRGYRQLATSADCKQLFESSERKVMSVGGTHPANRANRSLTPGLNTKMV